MVGIKAQSIDCYRIQNWSSYQNQDSHIHKAPQEQHQRHHEHEDYVCIR